MADKPPLPDFDGWDAPHFTPIPDQLFDQYLLHLSEAELKVLLYIMRRTFGFKKNEDAISLRQMAEGITTRDGTRLDWGAGVALRSIQRAIPALLDKGLIEADKQFTSDGDPATTVYRLRMKGRSQIVRTTGQDAGAGDDNLAAGVRTESLQQDTVPQDTEEQEDAPATAVEPYDPLVWAEREERLRKLRGVR
jgi:hypothetical protein